MPDLTVSANVDTLMQAADFAAFRTSLGLTTLATTTPGTGVATALGVNVGSAGAPVLFNGALGTPSSGTGTNLTGIPIATGISGLAANIATWLATPSSANLRAAMTDESGTGLLLFKGNVDIESIGFTVDGAGSAITTGKVKGFFTCPYAGTIAAWNIVVDTGTVTIKCWKIASGTAKPTVANVINTNGVALSSGTAVHSTTLTDFTTTAVAANDIFAFDITAISGPTELSFGLQINKT